MPRLFFAVPVSPPIARQLEQVLLPYHYPYIRLTPARSYHLTVLFLGEVPEKNIQRLLEVGGALCRQHAAFDLTFDQLVAMPPAGHPRMIWAQFHSHEALTNLAETLANELAVTPQEELLPHITLARLKHWKRVPFRFPELPVFQLPVRRVELWQSRTLPSGAQYTCIDGWPLGGKA